MILLKRLATGWRPLNAQAIPFLGKDIALYYLQSYRHKAFGIHTIASNETVTPFRKQLKDEAKARRATAQLGAKSQKNRSSSDHWELTVGIEVQAC